MVIDTGWGYTTWWSMLHKQAEATLTDDQCWWNERHWSAKPSVQQCMWLYLLPCAFCFVPAYAQFAQRFQTLSCFVHSISFFVCHAHSVLFMPMQSSLTSFWCSFTGFVQLIFSLADFTLSDTTAIICYIAFSCKLHSAFRLDQKTWSQLFTCLPSYRHSSFTQVNNGRKYFS